MKKKYTASFRLGTCKGEMNPKFFLPLNILSAGSPEILGRKLASVIRKNIRVLSKENK